MRDCKDEVNNTIYMSKMGRDCAHVKHTGLYMSIRTTCTIEGNKYNGRETANAESEQRPRKVRRLLVSSSTERTRKIGEIVELLLHQTLV